MVHCSMLRVMLLGGILHFSQTHVVVVVEYYVSHFGFILTDT